MIPDIDDWADDRLAPDLRDITRQAMNDNHVRHRPALAPANDNAPKPGRHPLIEYDEDGNVIRALRRPDLTPRCRPHILTPGKLPAIGVTHAMMHRAAGDEWRCLAPANDSDILPRRPRNKAEGQSDMADCLGDLLLWRSLTGGPIPDWAGAMIEAAANDDEPEREKEEIRPTENEVMASMPRPVAEQEWIDHTGRARWRHVWRPEDIELKNGRIARLGGFKFATATREVPDDASHTSNLAYGPKEYPERPIAPGDNPSAVPTHLVHRAGELLRYNPGGKGWRYPGEHARERRAHAFTGTNCNIRHLLGGMKTPPAVTVGKVRRPKIENDKDRTDHDKVTREFRRHVRSNFHSGSLESLRHRYNVGTLCKPSLPYGPSNLRELFLAGLSTGKDMSDGDRYSRVRLPVPVEIALDDNLDGLEMLSAFRQDHTDAADVLDVAMKAQSYEDIAASIGRISPHTGKSRLRRACETFRLYRLQFSPTRAALL